jgi:hypothetical protein
MRHNMTPSPKNKFEPLSISPCVYLTRAVVIVSQQRRAEDESGLQMIQMSASNRKLDGYEEREADPNWQQADRVETWLGRQVRWFSGLLESGVGPSPVTTNREKHELINDWYVSIRHKALVEEGVSGPLGPRLSKYWDAILLEEANARAALRDHYAQFSDD